MSGGSFDYEYHRVDEYYVGFMEDDELDEMMADLVELLHDLEWWKSGDYGGEQYREPVVQFKDKWFGQRDVRLRERILKQLDKVKETIESEGGH